MSLWKRQAECEIIPLAFSSFTRAGHSTTSVKLGQLRPLDETCSYCCKALQTSLFAHWVLPTPPFLFPLQVPTLLLIPIPLRHRGGLQPSTLFSFLYRRMKHWCESPSGKMEPVSGGVRGGSAPGGPILYCCPDDLERVPWKHFYLGFTRCPGGALPVWWQSPFTPEKKEITEGKRLEIIAGLFSYLEKESIKRKSFEVLLFMLHSSSSDR